jgi:AI-2 transport protein TqsA
MVAKPQAAGVSRVAMVLIAVIAAGAALRWLAGILTPLALAVFLAIMIDGFARVIAKRAPFLAERAALPIAIVASIALFGAAAFVIADNATSFVGQLAGYGPKIEGLIARVYGLFGQQAPPSMEQLVAQLNPTRFLGDVAKGLQNFASNSIFVLIYLGFLIASRSGFERKFVGLFPEREERQEAVQIFHAIRDSVERYLWVQTVTGLMIAAGSWIAMAIAGLDNALFWAFLIFIASYIPIVGGAVGIMAPPLFALMQFESFWPAVILLATLQSLQFVVGNIIQPRMQGDSLNIDPVVVLLALAFWGSIWGMAGAFLSTPLTVMAMVILAQFPGSHWIAVLLSADGQPEKLRAVRGDPSTNPEAKSRPTPKPKTRARAKPEPAE